jgi:hypothetical protein
MFGMGMWILTVSKIKGQHLTLLQISVINKASAWHTGSVNLNNLINYGTEYSEKHTANSFCMHLSLLASVIIIEFHAREERKFRYNHSIIKLSMARTKI